MTQHFEDQLYNFVDVVTDLTSIDFVKWCCFLDQDEKFLKKKNILIGLNPGQS